MRGFLLCSGDPPSSGPGPDACMSASLPGGRLPPSSPPPLPNSLRAMQHVTCGGYVATDGYIKVQEPAKCVPVVLGCEALPGGAAQRGPAPGLAERCATSWLSSHLRLDHTIKPSCEQALSCEEKHLGRALPGMCGLVSSRSAGMLWCPCVPNNSCLRWTVVICIIAAGKLLCRPQQLPARSGKFPNLNCLTAASPHRRHHYRLPDRCRPGLPQAAACCA